jgi:hypothetical protein
MKELENYRRIVRRDVANNNTTFSAPLKKDKVKSNCNDNNERFFIEYNSKKIIYVKDNNIVHIANDANIFPPIKFNEQIADLKERDELTEITKEEVKDVINTRFKDLTVEISDLRQLVEQLLKK